jgi:hypothetical protein
MMFEELPLVKKTHAHAARIAGEIANGCVDEARVPRAVVILTTLIVPPTLTFLLRRKQPA